MIIQRRFWFSVSVIVGYGLIYILIPIMGVATVTFLWPGWQYSDYNSLIFLFAGTVILGMVMLIVTHPMMKRWGAWLEGKSHED